MKKYRVEVTTPEDDYEKEFSTYQSALNYYTKIRDGNDFWSTIEMYDTETNELLAIEEKSNSAILSYLKEEKELNESKHTIVDGVDITAIVDDLYENHSWLMKKLGE